MDSFEVKARDTTLLSATSHIVEELQDAADGMDTFPVLIDGEIAHFHDIDGGFDGESDCHIVNLIHRVQGVGSPNKSKLCDDTVELHMENWYYNLDVIDGTYLTEYPDDDFVLSLKVRNYDMRRRSFSDALQADIDKRHQEFSHNNK